MLIQGVKNHGIFPFLPLCEKNGYLRKLCNMSGRGTDINKRGGFTYISNITQRDFSKNCR